MSNIRNFCIIAHIDHGKSTLADRLLETTHTVDNRKLKQQHLDQMDLERERGITIKLQPVRMEYKEVELNLIDTPGHVDFSYEVSRSLAACEGALLLVDATQGVQAQTIAHLYIALEQDLTIIPVINKIDLPAADVVKVKQEIISLIGCDEDEIVAISAKTGEGVPELLDEIVKRIPEPKIIDEGTKALIFDSVYDEYKGVIAYVRVISGEISKEDTVHFLATKTKTDVLEVGAFRPALEEHASLKAGEIGYVITGFRDVSLCQVGDTITSSSNTQPLPGYKQLKPMVFAGIFCKEGSDYAKLRDAMSKLKLNDAALEYEPEHSPVLGYGFRCGFLGLLHLEILQERLRREYDLDLIATVPSVAYHVQLKPGIKEIKQEFAGQVKKIDVPDGNFIMQSPLDFPDPSQVDQISEPYVKADIFVPDQYVGAVMELLAKRRGEYLNTEYVAENSLGQKRAILHYEMPLSSILVDFYDTLKSATSGYASLNYELSTYKEADVVRMDILVAQEKVDALSSIVYRDEAYTRGKKITASLKNVLPRQMFEVKLQAAIGSKVIASERIPPMRKDVTAKLYGGDVSRKRKLLEKQKKGKKKMQAMGKVDIPSEAYVAVLKG